ncbi:MAG: type IV pilus modification protein PilV [Halioglobus sp.]
MKRVQVDRESQLSVGQSQLSPSGNRAGTVYALGGFGFVEFLVSLLVFSVGVLGLAATQIAAKRANYEAIQRSIASSLANDIFERMRGNPGQLISYAQNEIGGSTLASTVDCNSAMCSTADLASFDLREWSELLNGVSEEVSIAGGISNAGGLVDSRACIEVDGGLVTIAIAWRGMSASTNPVGSKCGEPSALYGPSHQRRRLLLMKSFIGAL